MSAAPDEAFRRVLDYVAEGDSLLVACKKPGTVSRSAFQRRVNSDASFSKLYDAALQDRAQVLLDRYDNILNKLEEGRIDPSSARVLLDGLKTRLIFDDKRFADKSRHEISGPNNSPIAIQHASVDDLEVARFLGHLLDKQQRRTVDEPIKLTHEPPLRLGRFP